MALPFLGGRVGHGTGCASLPWGSGHTSGPRGVRVLGPGGAGGAAFHIAGDGGMPPWGQLPPALSGEAEEARVHRGLLLGERGWVTGCGHPPCLSGAGGLGPASQEQGALLEAVPLHSGCCVLTACVLAGHFKSRNATDGLPCQCPAAPRPGEAGLDFPSECQWLSKKRSPRARRPRAGREAGAQTAAAARVPLLSLRVPSGCSLAPGI